MSKSTATVAEIVEELGATADVERALDEMGLPPLKDGGPKLDRERVMAGLARYRAGNQPAVRRGKK